MTELRESLAAMQHAIWAHWMVYLFSVSTHRADGRVVIRKDLVTRWTRQMQTSYAMLTEQEKVSDREQADKILTLLQEAK